MFSTEQLDCLRREIVDDLAALRIWRDLGATVNVEKLNDQINLKLDRLRRFSRQTTPPTALGDP